MSDVKYRQFNIDQPPFEDETLIIIDKIGVAYIGTYQGTGEFFTTEGEVITGDEVKWWAYISIPEE